jgi:hypothetical protein
MNVQLKLAGAGDAQRTLSGGPVRPALTYRSRDPS